MQFVDAHCHIQFSDYGLDPEEVLESATSEGVTRLLVVGCTLADSKAAVDFVAGHPLTWSSIGLHPHFSSEYVHDHHALQEFRQLAQSPKVVAIGETGLDYHYMNSAKKDQLKMLRFQLDLASEHNLPVIFHVREAFDDFWPVFDAYTGLRGVLHSFTDSQLVLDEALARGLYIGLNGIMTFTKNEAQLGMVRSVPTSSLLLETDAPFLTPVPFRGTICQPKHVRVTAAFLAELKGESLESLAIRTTDNAKELFDLP